MYKSQQVKNFFHYIKIRHRIQRYAKNPQENLTTVEIDPVSGEHYIVIPEWVCDENGWYEGVEVNIEVDVDSIIIRGVD